jgi:hypothetical protein
MKSALSLDITQRIMIIPYRRFGTDSLSVPKRLYGIAVLLCIKFGKSADLIFIGAEARNLFKLW